MEQPKHLFDLLTRNAQQNPTSVAFRFFDTQTQTWSQMTWEQYRDQVLKVADHLQVRGVKKGQAVAILSSNRPEWIISDLAIQAIGAISIPIFATSTKQDITYILKHSRSIAIFVDHLDRLAENSEVFPEIVICFDRGDLKEIIKSPLTPTLKVTPLAPEDLATIVYTSGTTGIPKGVMHTHGNLMSAAKVIKIAVNEGKTGPDIFFSFLPLSHVAERALVEVGSLITASEVVFARKVETFVEDLVMFRPTILLCVPRLWEKIHERIQTGLSTSSGLKRTVFSFAQRLGTARFLGNSILKTRDTKLAAFMADRLVGNSLKKRLGIDRVRLFLTGSAPTRMELIKFFGSFGIFIREVYGLTENLCLGTYSTYHEIRLGSCGKAFPDNVIKVNQDGEVLFKAPWNFKGYYEQPTATAETLDGEGWLLTGDLGYVDPDGYLFITGRKKELLKTSNGKYIAPVPIEDELKSQGIIEDAIVIGEGRKYCIALVILNPNSLTDGNNSTLQTKIEDFVEQINNKKARHEQIKRIGVLKKPFTIEDGLLTPSLKLKRKVILDRYTHFVDQVYGSNHTTLWE